MIHTQNVPSLLPKYVPAYSRQAFSHFPLAPSFFLSKCWHNCLLSQLCENLKYNENAATLLGKLLEDIFLLLCHFQGGKQWWHLCPGAKCSFACTGREISVYYQFYALLHFMVLKQLHSKGSAVHSQAIQCSNSII